MAKVVFKQGEAKTLTLTITDEHGATVDLSGATLTLAFKKAKADAVYKIIKGDVAFNKTMIASGIVSVDLAEADTDLAEGTYIGELKATWGPGPNTIEKSADFYLQIKGAVIPPAAPAP